MPGNQFATSAFYAKRSLATAVATVGAVTGTGVDTTGYQTWCALIQFGTCTAGNSATTVVKIGTASDSSGTGSADITSATTGTVVIGTACTNSIYVIWGSCKTLANKFLWPTSTVGVGTAGAYNVSISFILSDGPTSTLPASGYTATVGPV